MTEIEKLIKKRDEFLEEHPHLKPMQRRLDQIMEGMTSVERCAYLSKSMSRGCKGLAENFFKLGRRLS